ncbi:hypothetical protein EKO04_007068 [Ascochyta lentis]|uniref:Uncharacterized protein n=1 Tax=Ascochyta lentis TaxID=205686 RepID=A0A8H7MCP7_9PLEO|nr:hypothetical protein EKO04_007068 [Ascochyta lentis]
MNTATQMHDSYTGLLMVSAFRVVAVVNDLKVSKIQFQKEARELLGKVEEMSIAFKELEIGMIKEWKARGKKELKKMVDALPEMKELKEMVVVKKYFSRQVREIQEAEEGAKVGTKHEASPGEESKKDGETCDSGCEMSP